MKKNIVKIKKRLSRYVKIFDFKDSLCFFNCLSLNKAYVSKQADLNSDRILKLFEKNNLLKGFDLKAKRFIKKRGREFKPDFKQLYLVISEACNFSCKYCRQVTHGLIRQNAMKSGEAIEIIDDFFERAKNRPKGIVFYGGEPLLNKKVLLDSVKHIRMKGSKLKPKSPIDLTVITNGTGIDKKSAKILSENDVYIIISMDGRKKEHDKLRVYKNGRGTFNDVLRGYKVYKSAGCKVGISCTIGSHNYRSLLSLFNYFAKDLRPINVGINLPHDDYNNPLNSNMDFKKFCRNFFKIFERAVKDNLYIEHIMRKLRLLFREEIKVNDCPACGGRLVALPGKKLGVCEGAIGMDNFFFKNIDKVARMSSDWYLTSPLFDKRCDNCLSVGLCGGGCPFDGYLQTKKVGHKDKRRCSFVKMIVKWGLYNFYLLNKKKIKNKKVFIPSIKEQNIFLKELKATKGKLPLRSSARFSKIRGKF